MSEYHWDSPQFVDFDNFPFSFLSFFPHFVTRWSEKFWFALLIKAWIFIIPSTAPSPLAKHFTAVFSSRMKGTPKWFFFLVDGVTHFRSWSREKQSGKNSHHDCECEENLHVDVLVSRSILQSKDWSMNYLCSFI